jgi:tetratricopeptide (TPR) repeat protein
VTGHELEDERSFLLRSLEDLDREHEAGDLGDEDYDLLRDGYVARTAAVLRSLNGANSQTATSAPTASRPPGAGPRAPGRPGARRRRVLVTAAVAAVIGVAVWAVVDQLSPRLPGESISGSISLSRPQAQARALAQAETLENQGDAVDALKLYRSVLQKDPTQEEALAEGGWLEYQAGAEARNGTLLVVGERQEQKAEEVAPGAFAPHLYLGSMALAQGNADAAVAQYRQFLADRPPRATVESAASFITDAFSTAHEPAPALPVAGSSSG